MRIWSCYTCKHLEKEEVKDNDIFIYCKAFPNGQSLSKCPLDEPTEECGNGYIYVFDEED